MRQRCGLPLNTYFSGVKMKWLLENSPAVKALAASDPNGDELCFSTIDTWLIAKLSGLRSVVTDSTNASRTMLMDINSLEWNQQNLDIFGVKKSWLPEIVKNSSDNFGAVYPTESPWLPNVPITGVLGDQQAACLGHLLRPGEVKTTYGTGCFILTNIGDRPVLSENGLLTTVCYRLDGQT